MEKAEEATNAAPGALEDLKQVISKKKILKRRTEVEMEQWVSQEMGKCVGLHRQMLTDI